MTFLSLALINSSLIGFFKQIMIGWYKLAVSKLFHNNTKGTILIIIIGVEHNFFITRSLIVLSPRESIYNTK